MKPVFCFCLAVFYLYAGALAAPQKPVSSPRVLSPSQLKGQIVYLKYPADRRQSSPEVWGVHPFTKTKTLLFKSLFISPKLTFHSETRGRYIGAHSLRFSPDARRIAFTDYDEAGRTELVVMDVDGKNRRKLTNTGYGWIYTQPRWSPDGEKLLYSIHSPYRSGGPGYTEVGVGMVDVETGRDISPTLPTSSYNPFWSRDGTRILFTYFPGNVDYMSEADIAPRPQSARPDGSDTQDFDGNWSLFDVPNSSPDGTIRYESVPFDDSSVSNRIWKQTGPSSFSRNFWATMWSNENFQVSAFAFPFLPENDLYAVQGAWRELKVNDEGMANPNINRAGIFLLRRSNQSFLKLLDTDTAALVQWLK